MSTERQYPVVDVPIDNLRYDFDEEIGCGHLGSFYVSINRAFQRLEKTLPQIPDELKLIQQRRFPRLLNVFNSIKEEGMENPLVVIKKSDLYRVRVGNQRLCSLRANNHTGTVKCIVVPEGVKITKDVMKYTPIEGCEGN